MLQAQAGVTDFQENMEALKHNFLLSGYFKKRGYEDSAELGANRIGGLPLGTPLKAFTYTAKELFDGRDSAKLKNQKSLNAGGEFLAQNQFGVAVVVASTGMDGDAQKDLVLTEARAMVVRDVPGGEFWIRRQAAQDTGNGQADGRRRGRGLGLDPDSHLPGGYECHPTSRRRRRVSGRMPNGRTR